MDLNVPFARSRTLGEVFTMLENNNENINKTERQL